jgi:DNA-binding transcriptional ArsR family regulator
MLADADLASIGRTLGDAHRARFVLALLGGEELPAGELAARAGTSSSLASAHLATLLRSGLVIARRLGRQRYYRLASPEIAHAIEALLAIAPPQDASGLKEVTRGKALQRARTCYDHLAGRLGVELADSFTRDGMIAATDSGWDLTGRGQHRLSGLGLDIVALRQHRRAFLRPCMDWTERRPHMAGSIGQALADHVIGQGWVRRAAGSRALLVTPAGQQQLLAEFAVRI